MANYRIFDDNGELESVRITETVLMEETYTDDTHDFMGLLPANRGYYVAIDSAANFANRLHISCEEEGDYGVIINRIIGTLADTATGAINLFDTSIATLSNVIAYPSNFALTTFVAKESSMLYATYIDATASISLSGVSAASTNDKICLHYGFKTNKLNCTIPINVNSANSTAFIYFKVKGADNKNIRLTWTTED